MGLNLHYNLLNYTKYPTELITLLSYKKNLNAKHNIYIYSAFTWNYKIYNYDNCGAKGIGDSGPFHIKLMAHAKEEKMFEDKQKKSRPPRCDAEDDPVLGRPRSRKEEVPRHQGKSPRASQWKA